MLPILMPFNMQQRIISMQKIRMKQFTLIALDNLRMN